MARARSSSMSGSRFSGPKQRHVSLDPRLHLLQAGELAGEHGLLLLELRARLEPMIADLEMIGEIAADTAGEQRKDEGRSRIASRLTTLVMAGLGPAIHACEKCVDARHEAGHDGTWRRSRRDG